MGVNSERPELPRIRLVDQTIQAISMGQCVRFILDELNAGRGGWVATLNIDHLRRLAVDQDFATTYEKASLIVADGMPLVWASRLQGTPLPERITGSDLIWRLSDDAVESEKSIFLLGGAPGTARESAKVMKRRLPGLRIAGTHAPHVSPELDERQLEELRSVLVEAAPDIVYVALGSPKQEQIIVQLTALLPRTWWIPVGISFSFVSGAIRRAPAWMQRTGLEWLHRLAQEPRRLAKRYLIHDFPYALSLLGGSALQRMIGREPPQT